MILSLKGKQKTYIINEMFFTEGLVMFDKSAFYKTKQLKVHFIYKNTLYKNTEAQIT